MVWLASAPRPRVAAVESKDTTKKRIERLAWGVSKMPKRGGGKAYRAEQTEME